VADALIVVADGAAARKSLPASFSGNMKVSKLMQMMVLVNRCDMVQADAGFDACFRFTEDVRSSESVKDVKGPIPVYLSSMTKEEDMGELVLNRSKTLDTVLSWIAGCVKENS